jgi:four helix bundle protein
MNSKNQFIENFRNRTKAYGLAAIRIFQQLPRSEEARLIGNQFLRAALSVGSNYRAVCRARSRAEFFSKLCITVEEADETIFWVEILSDAEIISREKISIFEKEGKEILAVLTTARKNTK